MHSNISETYVHRIGRTGRAGNKGVALSFCEHDDLEFLQDIEKLISQKIPVIEDHPFPKTNFTKSPPKQQRGQQQRRTNGSATPSRSGNVAKKPLQNNTGRST